MTQMNESAVRLPDSIKSSECRTYKGDGMLIYEDIQTETLNGETTRTRSYRICLDPPITDRSEFQLSEKNFRALARLMEGI
jgi:hypothetical protein